MIIDEEAIAKARPDIFNLINIEEFVNLSEIDMLYFDKPYYLVPNSKNQKGYVLLRQALKKTKKVGVSKVLIRTKEYLSIIMPHEHALLLYLLHFHDEIRKEDEVNLPKEPIKHYQVKPNELEIAVTLINQMADTFIANTHKITIKC